MYHPSTPMAKSTVRSLQIHTADPVRLAGGAFSTQRAVRFPKESVETNPELEEDLNSSYGHNNHSESMPTLRCVAARVNSPLLAKEWSKSTTCYVSVYGLFPQAQIGKTNPM